MTTTANGLAVRCEELVHIYRTGESDVVAVRGVDLAVAPGERVAVCTARPLSAPKRQSMSGTLNVATDNHLAEHVKS